MSFDFCSNILNLIATFKVVLLLLSKSGISEAIQRIECTNFSSSATISPMLFEETQLLIDFSLLSNEQICNSRRKMPKFNKLHIAPASYFTICEQCPQCTLTMPKVYQLPLSWTINKLFVITRQPPHHRSTTDVPIHYVIVDRLPTSPIKNCRIYVPNRSFSYANNLNSKFQFLASFFGAAFLVMLLIRCFCIKTH